MQKIIIDGVDVSKCVNYRENNGIIAPDGTPEKTDICISTRGFCDNIGNCYFKQLQRLKAENEKLKNCLRLLETNLTIIRNDFLTCMSECLATFEDESEGEQ